VTNEIAATIITIIKSLKLQERITDVFAVNFTGENDA
jgi:hypothetical protein